MKLEHLIITRFCIRFIKRAESFSGPSKSMVNDPMVRANLAFRSMMLRAISYPSLCDQTSSHFKWVIIIEPDMPVDILGELEEMIAPHDQFYLHTLADDDYLGYRHWMNPYIDSESDYLITTHLDDDDALPSNFVEHIQGHAVSNLENEEFPMQFYGTTNVYQWDMDFNEDYPFGTASRWHRNHFRSVSCGFSFVGKLPDIDLYILSAKHSRTITYFDETYELHQDDPNVHWMRDELRKALRKSGIDEERFRDVPFFNLFENEAPMLMTNHGRNLQVNRVHEPKEGYQAVTEGQVFERCRVDWPLIQKHRHYFESVQPWRRPNNAPFPKKQYLQVKWTLQEWLFGKDYYHKKLDERRPRTKAEEHELSNKE